MRRLAAAPAHALAPLLLAVLGMLGGCDLLGIEGASVVAARHEAEGKAIGAACRHAGRAIEDCYVLNRKADKGAVFAGWREMNDYMTENKLEVVAPTLPPPGAPAPVTAAVDDEGDAAPSAKSKRH
jgi:hypothetical protein